MLYFRRSRFLRRRILVAALLVGVSGLAGVAAGCESSTGPGCHSAGTICSSASDCCSNFCKAPGFNEPFGKCGLNPVP
jgi:hypothetical protein